VGHTTGSEVPKHTVAGEKIPAVAWPSSPTSDVAEVVGVGDTHPGPFPKQTSYVGDDDDQANVPSSGTFPQAPGTKPKSSQVEQAAEVLGTKPKSSQVERPAEEMGDNDAALLLKAFNQSATQMAGADSEAGNNTSSEGWVFRKKFGLSPVLLRDRGLFFGHVFAAVAALATVIFMVVHIYRQVRRDTWEEVDLVGDEEMLLPGPGATRMASHSRYSGTRITNPFASS